MTDKSVNLGDTETNVDVASIVWLVYARLKLSIIERKGEEATCCQ